MKEDFIAQIELISTIRVSSWVFSAQHITQCIAQPIRPFGLYAPNTFSYSEYFHHRELPPLNPKSKNLFLCKPEEK